jgi:hypothetical protein
MSRAMNQKGRGRGRPGLFIAVFNLQEGLGLEEIERRGKAPSSTRSPVERMGMTGGVRWSAEVDGLTGRPDMSASGGEVASTFSE